MKIILKNTLTFVLIMTMSVGIMQINDVCAEETEINSSNLVNALEQSDIVEYEDEEILYDEETVYDFVDKIDLSSINEQAIKNGLEPMTADDLYNIFIKGIEEVNKSLEDGELTMLSDGAMIDSDDDDFYLQGGSTKDIKHWWGVTRYKSTANANKWVKSLNRTAAAEAGIGVIAAAVLGPYGAIPGVIGGIGCWYCWDLASSVDYYNGLSKRGIVAKIPWVLVGYSVKKQ